MGLFDKIAQGMENAKANDNGAELADGRELYLKQKIFSIGDSYDIYDATEQPVYKVKGAITGLSFKITRADDSDVAEIKKKLISVSPTYDIVFTNGQNISLKKKIALLKEEFNGTVNGKALQITGNIAAYNFNVTVGGEKIGSVAKKYISWGDTYAISFTDDSWKDTMVALVVAIDNACHNTND